jgi:hypothetical protein
MRLLAFALALATSGCATLINTPLQRVNVTTTPPGATCVLDGQTFASPAVVMVRRERALELVCRGAEGREARSRLARESSNWGLGNFIMPPGFAVDAITGAAGQLPDAVHLDLAAVPVANGTQR